MAQSEREKMLAGLAYRASDPELVEARHRARRLMRLFNQSTEEESYRRHQLLDELLGSLGEKSEIEPPFYCDYGSNISIGRNFFANFGCVMLDCGRIEIGDDVLLGPGVQIYAAYHPMEAAQRASGIEYGEGVRIGSSVWIGGGVIILSGVTIGDKAVIGAGSVVTRDVPPNALAVGNPCRVLRTID